MFPQEVYALTRRIEARTDYEDCAYFGSKIAFASYAEVLYVLRLLAEGAVPCLKAPDQLGRTPKPIIDPATRRMVGVQPFLCLHLAGTFYFFQVSFATPEIYTVDALLWKGDWSVAEIDGEGHNHSTDKAKERAVALPFTRYVPSQLLQKQIS
jgi:hypothetical protein